MISFFFGRIKEKIGDGWKEFRGSYCGSSESEEPLKKNGIAYSWIPSFSSGNEYRIKNRGTYTYTVIMIPEDDSDGITTQSINEAKPTLQTKIRYELESTFVVEK